MLNKTSYYLFGFIKLWSVTRTVDEDDIYEKMRDRFLAELDSKIAGKR